MAKITYEDKVKLQDEPDIPNKNKVTDNDMNEIKDVVNTNADELDTAKENIENLEEGQGTNSTDITNLKGRMTTLETDNAKNKSDISNLQKDNETNKTNISNLQNNKVDKVEGKGLSTEDFTTALKTKLEGLENYNDAEIKNRIQILEDDNASNKMDITTLQNKVTTLEEDNTTNKTNITNLQKDIEDLEKDIEANTVDISNLQAENKNLKEEVESYKNSLPRETQTGEYITMQNTADKVKFKDFTLGGNSKQESSEIGNNILCIDEFTGENGGLEQSYTEDILSLNGSRNNNISTVCEVKLYFKESGNYKIIKEDVSGDFSNGSIGIRAYNASEERLFFVQISNTGSLETSGEITEEIIKQISRAEIYTTTGAVFNDYKCKIMLTKESITEYEKFTPNRPSPEFPSKIENVYAKNLVGGKWTNGLLNANGDLSNTDQNLYRHFKKILKAGTYTYSYSGAKGYLTQVRAVNLTTQSNLTVTDKTFTLEEDAEISLGFRKNDSTEWDIGENLEDIRFMLEEGKTATDYIQSGVVVANTNKNLANKDEIYINMKSYSPGNCTEETVDGRDCIRFANSRFRPDVENPFNLINYKYKENTAYTFKILAKAGELVVEGSDSLTFQAVYTDGSKISASKYKANATNFVELRFVTDPEKTIARVGFSYGTSCQWYMDKSSIFIAEGDTTDYVANEQQQVVFPLAQGQKLMLGDYLDDDGIHHVRKQVELDGTENWELRYTTENYCTFSTNLETPYLLSKDVKALCTHYKYLGTVASVNHMTVKDIGFAFYHQSTSSSNKTVYINTTQTTLEEFKAFLAQQKTAGTPVILEYDLAEEEVEPYTEEQQEAYNKLKELTTYATQTNIYSTNNIKPVFTVTGIKDVNSLITQVNQLILEGGN